MASATSLSMFTWHRKLTGRWERQSWSVCSGLFLFSFFSLSHKMKMLVRVMTTRWLLFTRTFKASREDASTFQLESHERSPFSWTVMTEAVSFETFISSGSTCFSFFFLHTHGSIVWPFLILQVTSKREREREQCDEWSYCDHFLLSGDIKISSCKWNKKTTTTANACVDRCHMKWQKISKKLAIRCKDGMSDTAWVVCVDATFSRESLKRVSYVE